MSKITYRPGEKFEASANRLFAHLDELGQALKSLKAHFPEMPIAEPGAEGGSLTWVPREQEPKNLIIMVPGWAMSQLLDQRFCAGYRVDIRISSAARHS